MTLEVEPIIGPDGYTIDLNLPPQVVEFDGFINYGSPINGPTSWAESFRCPHAKRHQSADLLHPQSHHQRKHLRRSTVVLGGLVREDVQRVQDKVPILGDIPLVGRLFRCKVDSSIKRNLIIFVTARLMDAEEDRCVWRKISRKLSSLWDFPKSFNPRSTRVRLSESNQK